MTRSDYHMNQNGHYVIRLSLHVWQNELLVISISESGLINRTIINMIKNSEKNPETKWGKYIPIEILEPVKVFFVKKNTNLNI